MEADFSGYATKSGLLCSDGRTIRAGAFKNQHQTRVPLVWMHQKNEPTNVLGHAMLEDRPDGTYAYAYFNQTEAAKHAKEMVKHGDITALSIYANRLVEKSKQVLHGAIQEVSLVLSGANPGAQIDNVNLAHGDEMIELPDEAVIFTGLSFEHSIADTNDSDDDTVDENNTDEPEKPLEHAETTEGAAVADTQEKTVKSVFDAMTDEQKNVVYFLVGSAAEALEDGDDNDDAEHGDQDDNYIQHQEGTSMPRNVFEGETSGSHGHPVLTHSQISEIVKDAEKFGSLKDSVLYHAEDYGITDIELLFPDAKAIESSPELLARQTEWVKIVLNGVKHSPFAKIKSIVADITAEEARARGYVKGTLKKDEVVKLLKRTTSPTTIYKKQRLDRDDLIDIVDFDVVAWLKAEIRLMLNEELARAILVGDGRPSSSDDKVKDPEGAVDGIGIRSIANDHEMYAHQIELPANISPEATIEEVTRSRTQYRGTGTPTMFTTDNSVTDMLLLKDRMGRRLYDTEAALASVLRVKEIVPVEVLEAHPDILAIIVNLQDYTVGANKGGELSFFEDFDIDYNQNKYLLETRVSGGLTKPKSAIVIRRATGTAVTPTSPSFNAETNTVTVPSTTGVIYSINGEPVTGDVVIEEDTTVTSAADENYYIPANTTTEWTFSYNAGV